MQKIHHSIHCVSIFVLLTVFGCASHDTTRIEDYNKFAIRVARADLWNEAIFRWKQVVSIAPEHAAAHNNLGVAYEALGRITEAITAYQRATELDPDSKYYRFNYRRCRLHLRRSGAELEETPPVSSEDEPVSSEDEVD